MNDLSTADNSSEATSDNLTTTNGGTTTVTTSGTGIASGQPSSGAGPAADDIFKGIDPNRLPPELKSNYDNMLRDYRDKTAKLSETIKSEVAKSTESYKSKAEQYDQIAAEAEFVRQWNDYVQKSQAAGTPAMEGDPVLTQLKAQLDEVTQKIQMTELHQVTDAFADAVDEKGQKMHPDFDHLNSIVIGQSNNGGKAEEYSLLRACIELAPGRSPQEKLANGYKAARAQHDAIFEAGKKAGMGRLQQKAQNGSFPPSNSGAEALSVTEKKPKSAREALDMAKRGMMVSRD